MPIFRPASQKPCEKVRSHASLMFADFPARPRECVSSLKGKSLTAKESAKLLRSHSTNFLPELRRCSMFVPCAGPNAFRSPGSQRETLRATRSRRKMAPQPIEKIESAPGNGMVSKAWNVQDVIHGRAADPARLPLTSRDAFRSAGAPRERLRATEVAWKWRRNRLKRLNPRREMVWPRKPLTYKVWYTRAADRARLRLTSRKNDKGCVTLELPLTCETNRDGAAMMREQNETRPKRTGIVGHASCEREPIFVLRTGAARELQVV
jgi:hypothetical protein